MEVQIVETPERADPSPGVIPCLAAGEDLDDLQAVRPGTVDRRAGRAAYAFLNTAIDLALAGRIDAIATLPLNKYALHAAGVAHPGHTEILAERCKAPDHAMMLYMEGAAAPSGPGENATGSGHGSGGRSRHAARGPAAGL